MSYSLKDYFYILPDELIAQEACHPHHDARLMIIERETGELIQESQFINLDTYMPENRVIYFNNSRVLPSRLSLQDIRFEKTSGERGILGKGEIFFLRKTNSYEFEALIQPGNKFKIGTKLFAFGVIFEVKELTKSGRILSIEGGDIMDILQKFGQLPLPPYIEYSEEKAQDYQTVFARHDGSVAAPTASLHFTEELLKKLSAKQEYITLHVGIGTFQGITTEDIRDYEIHGEWVEVEKDIFTTLYEYKTSGKRIVAVGTTVCRTLESLPYLWKELDETFRNNFTKDIQQYWDSLDTTQGRKKYIYHISIENNIHFETSIYITPGFQTQIVDDLITNFHLPESSLLVLVSSFIGREQLSKIYETAIKKKYRFYSFGDGMYIRGK